MRMREIKGAEMEVLILELFLFSCFYLPPEKKRRGRVLQLRPRQHNAGVMPQHCSETWVESNCEGPRLGIFGGAGLARAPPPAAADWSLGGEVNRSSAVSQRRATGSGEELQLSACVHKSGG